MKETEDLEKRVKEVQAETRADQGEVPAAGWSKTRWFWTGLTWRRPQEDARLLQLYRSRLFELAG